MLSRGLAFLTRGAIRATTRATTRAISIEVKSVESKLAEALEKEIVNWKSTGNPVTPFKSKLKVEVGGQHVEQEVSLKIGDYPEEHLVNISSNKGTFFRTNELYSRPNWKFPVDDLSSDLAPKL